MSMMSQAERLRDRVLQGAAGHSFGQMSRIEYVASRHGSQGAAVDQDLEGGAERLWGRWKAVRVSQDLEPGGFAKTADGLVRIRETALAERGMTPRLGDLVRLWSPDGSFPWWQVRGFTEPGLSGEWVLELGEV